ncbi:hypothetical protein D9758_008833 [Tetrapyrgos nigripes]|uniref:GH18 domain-containing protein n=1 Tax=Tetrapyrgos nigripes TaxID=182062 RepID=A0A8H5FPI8_9AGAR|nr:hypothetical protein D9758_008833 [Tetrapyrgos nigripes]
MRPRNIIFLLLALGVRSIAQITTQTSSDHDLSTSPNSLGLSSPPQASQTLPDAISSSTFASPSETTAPEQISSGTLPSPSDPTSTGSQTTSPKQTSTDTLPSSSDPASTTQTSTSDASTPTSPEPESGQWDVETNPDGSEEVFFAPSDSNPLMIAYYADWTNPTIPDFLDWIDFAFAIPTKSFSLAWDDPHSAPLQLAHLVSAAHAVGTKVKLSIGGWTGSRYFSPAVSSPQNRQTFVKSIVDTYYQYNLDGIEIDWEYPGREGQDGNLVDHKDSQNFLAFLQLLRSCLPRTAKLTAAVAPQTFADEHGQPMKDCSGFAKVLDWILIMNYDTFDGSPDPGPNAPLFDGCKNSTEPDSNAVGAFKIFKNAGFREKQMVLGIPAYGYAFRRHPSPAFVKTDDGGDRGSVTFRSLIQQNALQRADDGSFQSSGGFSRQWDECSSTPFLHSSDGGQVISYDDPESVRKKARFAQAMGMRGVNLFELSGDTEDWALLKAMAGGLYSS